MISDPNYIPKHFRRKVLFLAPQPFYENRGTPIAISQVLRALSKLDYWVDLVTYPVGQQLDIPRIQYYRPINPFCIKHVPIGFSFKKIFLDLCMLPCAYQLLRINRYFCIHAVEEAAIFGLILGRLSKTPLLYDMQSSLPEQMKSYRFFKNRLAQWLVNLVERYLLKYSDRVMCSTGLKKRIQINFPKAKFREWSYACELSSPSKTELSNLRKKLQIPNDASVVAYTGSFEKYQGLDLLLSAASIVIRKHKNVYFLLVGGTGKDIQKKLKVGKKIGIQSNLRIIAKQPRKNIGLFLYFANILVSTRITGNNLPLKIIDYLATGRAIVATDIHAHSIVLNENTAVLADLNAVSVADQIIELLNNPLKAEYLGNNAKKYYQDNFGWARLIEDVNTAYSY